MRVLTLMVFLTVCSGCKTGLFSSPDADPYQLLLANTMGALAGVGVQSSSTPQPTPQPTPNPGPAPEPPTPVNCPLCLGVGKVSVEVRDVFGKQGTTKIEFTEDTLEKMSEVMAKNIFKPIVLTKESSPPEKKEAPEAPIATATNWRTTDLWEAQRLANEEKKPVFCQFSSPDCSFCVVMNRKVFANTMVADYLNEHFITCEIDTSVADKEILKAYKVTSWPTSMIFTKDWKQSKRLDRTDSPNSMLAQLTDGLAWANSPNSPSKPPVKPISPSNQPNTVYYYIPDQRLYNDSYEVWGDGYFHSTDGYSGSGNCSSGGCSSGRCGSGFF